MPKLKAMVRYFASNTDPRLLGKTKLMKLFYFADFGHVKKYASPITYDNYVHLEHGPIPSTILNLVNAVENDVDSALFADTISIEVKPDLLLKRIVPTRGFAEKDEKLFSASELDILQEVCRRFSDKIGKYLEDRSHEESAWRNTVETEDIPYTLAIEDPDCQVTKEEIEFVLKALQK